MRCNPGHHSDVVRILTDDSVYPMSVDDGSPDAEQFGQMLMRYLHSPGVFILKPRVNTILMFLPTNCITFDMHIGVINGGGRRHIDMDALNAVVWMCENTKAQKFTAMIPAFNIKTISLAERVGMVKEGIITKSFMKDGKIYDNIVYGATRDQVRAARLKQEDTVCQQQSE